MAVFAWCLLHGDDLIARQWGQDLLVWHQRSGDTHLLSGSASRVFARLQQGSASTAEIRHSVLSFDAPPSEHEVDVEATLQDLMRLGLVTAHPL